MGLNETPSANRVHIGIFGKRNAGKSSVMNALTNQSIAIVSDVRGTTTDPVLKAMELLPIGPVVMIDTPGIDDEGELGALRVKKSYQMLNKTDIAVVVIDGAEESPEDIALIEKIKSKGIPYAVFHNKSDLLSEDAPQKDGHYYGSALNNTGIAELKEAVIKLADLKEPDKKIVGDLLDPLDTVVLVIPIDSAAPKGRLILPQQQTIRDILDAGGISIVVKDTELEGTLKKLGTKPKLVITDSQAFEQVSAITPDDILLTSFSILFARHKGILEAAVKGAAAIDRIKDSDKILISEGCTHHRQCDDIGTVKLPRWIKKYTGKDVTIDFTSGTEFPDDLSPYSLIIHCGACMLNEKEVRYRYRFAEESGVPITNYGTAIAHMNGILKRSVKPFKDIYKILG
ncbi:MAG: [FeFe] hydrogenase H-cluster maturation GTPase HydF [Oscillospiraceae bacterium]|nr:[FeFe] hydrogenase H-cluster maturation GTPase HydF [Oscillospiraceae bacterium]